MKMKMKMVNIKPAEHPHVIVSGLHFAQSDTVQPHRADSMAVDSWSCLIIFKALLYIHLTGFSFTILFFGLSYNFLSVGNIYALKAELQS